jgi:protein CMS1
MHNHPHIHIHIHNHSPAAVRANDIAKELRVRLPNQRTAKLFAKHLKVAEQASALQKEFNALAVGTPNRLSKLLEAGALSLGNCRLLVLDASFKDAKQFTLLSLPGVAKDVALLLREHVLPALEGGQAEALRIAMF